MSANDPNFEEASRDPNWEAIFTDVNCWRSACMHHFSIVEMAVTETLLALSAISVNLLRSGAPPLRRATI